MKSMNVRGAHLHNLKNINVSLPKNKLITATGVSGSGKSSLAFDIIFEEGRKLYLRSLGVFTGLEEEQKFESISGIGPTIAVQQNIIRQSNPRSTVGSRTGILGILALLYTAEGRVACGNCGAMTGDDLVCGDCRRREERLPASYFSYNNPNGMCLTCSGRGAYYQIDLGRLVPDELTTPENIFDTVKVSRGLRNVFRRNFTQYLNVPFIRIPDEVKTDILYGHFVNSNAAKRSICLTRILEGHIRKYGKDPSGIYELHECPECSGLRIGEEVRRVLLNGSNFGELCTITLEELSGFLDSALKQKLISDSRIPLVRELELKIAGLARARLGHLSLFREISTLSGGEMQRLFLASHLDSKMDSIIYILDEPTAGLHEVEKAEILNSIRNLKDLGNTVIIVEHERTMIEAADIIIDLGPGAGAGGGELIYCGDLEGLLACGNSVTGRYLSGRTEMPRRNKISIDPEGASIRLHHGRTNNLKDVNVSIPLGVMVGIAGVSGSGKSSLISDTLVPLLKAVFHDLPKNSDEEREETDEGLPVPVEPLADRLEGTESLGGFAEVSQEPIGRNMNSNPVSYIGIWDKIRRVFSGQAEAAGKVLSPGHFSFNSKGACSSCGGSGVDKIWLGGNMFITNECGECGGTRYNDKALSVTYRNKNIHEILEMSFTEAVLFFENEPAIVSSLKVMERIGMGYIKLGQPTPTLSGGEAQRIKLAKEIGRRRKGTVLYVFDEPTSGLSMYDTARLILLLDELVIKGNSVIVIEHDPYMLSSCDWLIELGPGGGTRGGNIIAEGTVDELKCNPDSVTGEYLL